MNHFRLEELRDFYNLTKKDLAANLGISDSIYARWENEKDIIPTRRLYQLANYYKVNIDYLLGLSNEKKEIESENKIDIEKVSSHIREIRKDYNESLRTFANRLHTSNSTWSAYETGKVLILCAFLIQICNTGHYSADWILGRTETKYIKN